MIYDPKTGSSGSKTRKSLPMNSPLKRTTSSSSLQQSFVASGPGTTSLDWGGGGSSRFLECASVGDLQMELTRDAFTK